MNAKNSIITDTPKKLPKATTQQVVNMLAQNDEDFEWYPTTQEIIACIKSDMDERYLRENPSLLDCGAGDGRVLEALTSGAKYAIEKAQPLIHAMANDIFIVGTEFTEQTLIDKKVDVVFSNPPYSEFSQWACKIIEEANASYIYLVIPQRWENDLNIEHAIEARSAASTVLGEFNFLEADRRARAKVHIVRIDLCSRHNEWSQRPKTDPFNVWFEKHFHLDINNKEHSKYSIFNASKSRVKKSIENALVDGRDLITTLQALYQNDLDFLISTYKKLEGIDAELLEELNVNLEGVRGALQQKIEGLKDIYWNELFNRLDKVTDRLTKDSRELMLKNLTAYTHVDFTAQNAYAVVIWAIKNANQYFDDQLIKNVERLTEKANISLYTSNTRTFGDEKWRYCRTPEDLSHYKLDYRVVLTRAGGLSGDGYWHSRTESGLSDYAADLINDLRTVATNLGYDASGYRGAHDFSWESNKKVVFHALDRRRGELIELFEAKAFKNGNLHIKFNQAFMCRLNVEFGRLKGWVKSKEDAAHEMAVSIDDCGEHFDSNHKIHGQIKNVLRFTV